MRFYTVYIHVAPNGKKYVGITCQNIYKRWGHNGMGYYEKRRKNQLPFWNAIQKYGWNNFEHIIMAQNLSKEDACNLEIYLITKYKTTDRNYGYNITKGGEGVYGFTHSDETRKKLSNINKGKVIPDNVKLKISIANKGRPNTWQKGKPMPEELRLKMANSLKGHIVTEETREKIRKANIGRKHTDEERLKISMNNKSSLPEVREKISNTIKEKSEIIQEKRRKTIQERYGGWFSQSEEANRKRSEKMKGVKKSDETRQKMRKPKSPEAIENMRKAQQRRRKLERMGGSGK